MTKKTYTIDDLLSALRDAELEYERPQIEQYLTDLGFTEQQLNPELISQIVDDLVKHWKEQSAIAVQETKPTKATRSSKPAKATAQPQQQANPQHAFSGIASQVGQQVNDLVEVVEEECSGWEQGAAAHLHNRFAAVPNNILGYVAGMAEEARYNAADFREQVRAGIGAFRTY